VRWRFDQNNLFIRRRRCDGGSTKTQVFLPPQENFTMQTNENQSPKNENPKFFYVYILHCNDGGIYTGCTSDLQERFNRHQKGWVPITKERLPVRLAWCCSFPDRGKAFEFEQYLKSGSGRAFAKKHLLAKSEENLK